MNSFQEINVAAEPTSSREIVFQARGITKIYEFGEVKVHALRGVDMDLFRGEFVVLLGPRAAGNRPCSTFSAVWTSHPAVQFIIETMI